MSTIYSQTNNPGDHWMTDTSLILYKPKNKSSAENTTNTDMYLISSDNDNICFQCGHDHSRKVTGGSAIQDMISFLDRDISSES
jgi:hypothetical protein